jgi:hypothetical protein
LECQAVVSVRGDLIEKIGQVLERLPRGTPSRGHDTVQHQPIEVFDSLGLPHLVGEAEQQVFGLVGFGPSGVGARESGQPVLDSMIEQELVPSLLMQ